MRSSRGDSRPPSQQPTPHSPRSNIVVPNRLGASDKAVAECHGRQKPKPKPRPGSGADNLPRPRSVLPCSAGSKRKLFCNAAASAKSSSEVSGCAGTVPPVGGDFASSTIYVGGLGLPQGVPDQPKQKSVLPKDQEIPERWGELAARYTRTVSNLPREQKETRRSQAVVAGQEAAYKRATKRRRQSPSPRHSPSTTAPAEDALTTALLAEGGENAARRRRRGAHGADSTHVAGLQGSRELPSSAPGRPAAPVTGTAQSDVPAIQASQVAVGQTRVVKMERVTKPVGTVVETASFTLLADAAAALPIPPNQLPEQPQVQPGPIRSIQHDGPSASSKSDRTPDIARTTPDPIRERAGVLLSNPLKGPPSAYPPPGSQAAAAAVSPPLGLSNPASVGGQREANHGSGAAFVPVSAVPRGVPPETPLGGAFGQTLAPSCVPASQGNPFQEPPSEHTFHMQPPMRERFPKGLVDKGSEGVREEHRVLARGTAERRRLREGFLTTRSMQTGESPSLMAADHVELSHRPYDPIPDNNNHPVPSPSLHAGHQTISPTPVLIEGTLLLKPAPVQPAVAEQVHPSQPRTNSFQSTLNLEDPVDESERKRQRVEVLPTHECTRARARHAIDLLDTAREIVMPETPAVRSHSPMTYGRPRNAMLNNETHTRDASHSASSARQAEGNPSHGCPYRKRNPRTFNVCRHPECASPLRGFPELLNHIREHHVYRSPLNQAAEDPEDGVAGWIMDEWDGDATSWPELWTILFPKDKWCPSSDFEPREGMLDLECRHRAGHQREDDSEAGRVIAPATLPEQQGLGGDPRPQEAVLKERFPEELVDEGNEWVREERRVLAKGTVERRRLHREESLAAKLMQTRDATFLMAANPVEHPPYGPEQYTLEVGVSNTKSRVDTQITIKLRLSHLPLGVTKVHIPKHTISKPKFWTKPPPGLSPDTLQMYTVLVCTSAMQVPQQKAAALQRAKQAARLHKKPASAEEEGKQDQVKTQEGGEVLICDNCISRERRRAGLRKSRHPQDEEAWRRDEARRIIVFNTQEVKEWAMQNHPECGSQRYWQVKAPMRIACYCRHHAEQQGFQIIFTLADHIGNIIAQTLSESIMITRESGAGMTSVSGAELRPRSGGGKRALGRVGERFELVGGAYASEASVAGAAAVRAPAGEAVRDIGPFRAAAPEHSEAPNERVVFGREGDESVVQWASRSDVAIIERGEGRSGWALKSPRKRGPTQPLPPTTVAPTSPPSASLEEDALIFKLKGSGTKWADISNCLPGRSSDVGGTTITSAGPVPTTGGAESSPGAAIPASSEFPNTGAVEAAPVSMRSLSNPPEPPSPASKGGVLLGPSTDPGCHFICPHCGKGFPRWCDLNKHINNHTKRRKCEFCTAGGAETKDLNRHMWAHHPNEARNQGL